MRRLATSERTMTPAMHQQARSIRCPANNRRSAALAPSPQPRPAATGQALPPCQDTGRKCLDTKSQLKGRLTIELAPYCADQSMLALYSTPQISLFFRPADFATLTSLQMRPATLSRSGARSLRSAKNRSASSTRCTSIDDYHMSLPRIELGDINHA